MFESKTKNTYVVECYSQEEVLKWKDSFENIVVTEGLNKYINSTLKLGASSPSWYVALKGSGSVVLADTMSSHGGWSEITPYSNSTRPAWTPGTVSGGSVDNSGSKATFTIDTSATVYGACMTDSSAKGGVTGTLFGAGDFPVSKVVSGGDTLYVTVTCAIT